MNKIIGFVHIKEIEDSKSVTGRSLDVTIHEDGWRRLMRAAAEEILSAALPAARSSDSDND